MENEMENRGADFIRICETFSLMKVESSNVEYIGFCLATKQIGVIFKKSNSIYYYSPKSNPETPTDMHAIFTDLRKSESPGKFIAREIKGKLEHVCYPLPPRLHYKPPTEDQ